MMRKKQGMTDKEVIVGLIIVLILALIWVSAGDRIVGLFTQNSDELCRLSVLKKGTEKMLTAGAESPSPLQCYTEYVSVKKDGIYTSKDRNKEYRIVSFKDKSTAQKEELIKRFMADELAGCWSKFGEGQYDFLGEYDTSLGGQVLPISNMRCFPCADIYFEEGYLNGFTFGDFEDYLSTAKTSKGIGYKDYLLSESTEKPLYSSSYSEKKMGTASGKSVVVYFIAGKSAFYDPEKSILAKLFLYTQTNVRGTMVSWAYVVNPEDVGGKCDQLY